MVAQKPKMVNCLLVVVLLTTIIATGCTFTNEKSEQIGSEGGDEVAIVTIEMEGGKDIPDAVIDYAKEFVELQVDYYNNAGKENPTGKGEYSITKAKIVDLTSLNTGTAALTFDVSMWLLEYRLLPDDIAKVPIVGGMQLEEIDGQSWITEWGSSGQPYLVLLYNYVTDTRQRMGVINTDSIMHDYGTPEMLERYGNEFTAAAMEMYYKSVPGDDNTMSETADRLGITHQNYPKIDGSTSTLSIVKTINQAMYQGIYNDNYPDKASKTVPSYKLLIEDQIDLAIAPYASAEILVEAENKVSFHLRKALQMVHIPLAMATMQ